MPQSFIPQVEMFGSNRRRRSGTLEACAVIAEVYHMRLITRLAVLVAALLVPTAVFAQASITGTVKDSSGAVLPGVTVEAASPVLIEKVRSATTDGSGQFRIIDLRPGSYTV